MNKPKNTHSKSFWICPFSSRWIWITCWCPAGPLGSFWLKRQRNEVLEFSGSLTNTFGSSHNNRWILQKLCLVENKIKSSCEWLETSRHSPPLLIIQHYNIMSDRYTTTFFVSPCETTTVEINGCQHLCVTCERVWPHITIFKINKKWILCQRLYEVFMIRSVCVEERQVFCSCEKRCVLYDRNWGEVPVLCS